MLRLFDGQNHAELYAKYRPTYPESVAKVIMDYTKEGRSDSKLVHIVDAGCGNGQATEMYRDFFDRITAFDTSASQIAEAKKKLDSKITYLVGSAEAMPVEDNSVDLISSAQAIHWADFPKFLKDCRRTLKKDGSVALYGYKLPVAWPIDMAESDAEPMKLKAFKMINEFSSQCIFHPNIRHVNNGYEDIYPLCPENKKKRVDSLKIERIWDLNQLSLCVQTWSGYQEYLRQQSEGGEEVDILRTFLDNLKTLWGVSSSTDEEVKINVTWDIFIVLFRLN